jgi:catechol 2,3-dioxygenase-like lactoylglutathione lyase family enzyme
MAVELNHTIVWCANKERSAAFIARILGRPAPTDFMHFKVVELDNKASLDFMEKEGEVSRQHYAFLVGEEEFDSIFARVEAEGSYWADPARSKPSEINRHFGGRGVYFEDPDGHLLEIITRPYANG